MGGMLSDYVLPKDSDLDESSPDEFKAQAFTDQLLLMPKKFREFYLWQRLRDALEFVRRNQGTEDIDDELTFKPNFATTSTNVLCVNSTPSRNGQINPLLWAYIPRMKQV